MNATLFGLSGIYKGTYISLSEDRLIIGREAPAGLLFSSDVTVSRRHAALLNKRGIWYCVDSGSTNGTFVDNERLGNRAVRLSNGATLRFGQQIIRIDYVGCKPRKLPAVTNTQSVAKPAVKPPEPEYKIPSAAIARHSPPKNASMESPANPDIFSTGRWFGPNDVLQILDYTILNPLVFAGRRFTAQPQPKNTVLANGFEVVARISPPDDEPSLINPDLSVKPVKTRPSPLYRDPDYRWMSPGQRHTYLRWLADGRRSRVEEGYLFLFFYGIERRLVGPGSERVDRRERVHLLSEVEELLKRYPSFASFRQYATRLVMANWQVAPEFIKPGYLKQLPFADSSVHEYEWLMACLAANTENFGEIEATVLLTASRSALAARTVVKRCWPEIEQLFRSKFKSTFQNGIMLRPTDDHIVFYITTRNESIRKHLYLGTLTAHKAADAGSILNTIQDLAQRCVASMDEYSRKLGPKPTNADRIRAQTALPAEIRPAVPVESALTNELRSAGNGAISSFPLGKLLSLAGFGDLPASKSVIVDLWCSLDSAGFIMEPDPRFGAPTPKSGDLVCVAPATGLSDQLPSRDYLAAVPLATLAASVARADGRHSSDETSVFVRHVSNTLTLSVIEKERLNVHIAWTEIAKPRVNKSTIDRIPPDLREAVADLLVSIAIAGGGVVPAEMTELLRIFKMLGIPEARLYTSLHKTQSDGSAHVSSSIARLPAEVGQANIESRPSFIDMGVVQSKLKNTEHISAILTEIFTDEATDEPVVFNTTSIPARPLVLTFLERLTSGEISASAFEVMASAAGLLPNAAFEMLNNLALDKCNELLLDGEDPIYVDGDVLRELQT